MKQIYGISKRTGSMSERYYTALFATLGLDYGYTTLNCTDLKSDLDYIVGMGAHGIDVESPYKRKIIDHLDIFTSLVCEYDTCNTVVISGEFLKGHNTDHYGLQQIPMMIDQDQSVAILGSGSTGTTLSRLIPNAIVYSPESGNWARRDLPTDVIINCTMYGTTVPDSPIPNIPKGTSLVIDLAVSADALRLQCESTNVKYIGGREFYNMQFIKQFEIFTGVTITSDQLKSIEHSM